MDYAAALRRSWDGVRKNWVVSFAPLAYSLGLSLVGAIVGALGIIGGSSRACKSSLRQLGALSHREHRARGESEFRRLHKGFHGNLSLGIGTSQIAFILWIPMRVLAMALESAPNGALVYGLIQIALYVLLNPVPEFIYQSRLWVLNCSRATISLWRTGSSGSCPYCPDRGWLHPTQSTRSYELWFTGFSAAFRHRVRVRSISYLLHGISRLSIFRAQRDDASEQNVSIQFTKRSVNRREHVQAVPAVQTVLLVPPLFQSSAASRQTRRNTRCQRLKTSGTV